jgi:hypothetical protein
MLEVGGSHSLAEFPFPRFNFCHFDDEPRKIVLGVVVNHAPRQEPVLDDDFGHDVVPWPQQKGRV